jgi:uncharacterized delta-60 repeat protein
VQPDGRIIIGGEFTSVGGTVRNRIARLNPDGSLDVGFNPNADGIVAITVSQPDGKIVIGGQFTTVAGATHNRIARLNPDGTLDPAFNPNVPGTAAGFSLGVFSMALQRDGKIIIGGTFNNVGGVTRNYLARLNTDGTLDTNFNPNVSGGFLPVVQGTIVQTDGKIIIGGQFTAVSSQPRFNMARLNADGSLDLNFNANANGEVDSVAIQADGKIVIGGKFTSMGGVARTNLARLANEAATQSLTVTSTSRIEWLRAGTSQEAQYVAFELSVDAGRTWAPLGIGTRIPDGWELTGLSLPASGQVRARARVADGVGSSGLIETVTVFSLASAQSPRLGGMTRLGSGAFQFSFPNLSGITFTANLTLPLSNWSVLGPATEISPGQFQFTDHAVTNFRFRFYQIRSP